jgi:hypothetical protein
MRALGFWCGFFLSARQSVLGFGWGACSTLRILPFAFGVSAGVQLLFVAIFHPILQVSSPCTSPAADATARSGNVSGEFKLHCWQLSIFS